jgi:hypothetical protein
MLRSDAPLLVNPKPNWHKLAWGDVHKFSTGMAFAAAEACSTTPGTGIWG